MWRDDVAVLLTTQAFDSKKTWRRSILAPTLKSACCMTVRSILFLRVRSGFEGAHIHDGMRAAPGAIERVRISGKDVQVTTIGTRPRLVSAERVILNAISEMLEWKVLDKRGSSTARMHG